MSSIPELLKRGFDNDDWSYVSEAYHMLMGEYLLVEKPTIMASGTLEPEPEPAGFSKEVIQTEKSDYISKAYKGDRPEFKSDEGGQQARKEPMNLSTGREQWTDDGTIATNEKVSENPSLGVANPVARNRRNTKGKTQTDVRLDRSEKLKDINE
jgi:hypothetical protein